MHGAVLWTQQFTLCGSGNRGGVLVVELEKNSFEEPCHNAATVAHYFVNSSGIASNRTETDIGLSVMANIGSSNGNLDITVEGPEKHPPFSLSYVFDQVITTGIWKPTMCPHCDHIRRGKIFWQSDSENSDGVPMAMRRGSRQNVSSIANGGWFEGNGNGNYIENNVMVFRTRW